MQHDQSEHQKAQIKVINDIEAKVQSNTVNFSTVEPIADYENDPRMSITSVHFPERNLLEKIQKVAVKLIYPQVIFS